MQQLRQKAKKKVASKLVSSSTGQATIVKLLGEEGAACVEVLKSSAGKVDGIERAKALKTSILKLATKVGLLFQAQTITLETVKPAEGPIFIAANAMIDTLEQRGESTVDHREISDLLMECERVCLPIIKPHMKQSNSHMLSDIISYYASQKFMTKFLNDSALEDERKTMMSALQILLRPYETEDTKALVAARKRRLEKFKKMSNNPMLREFLNDDEALKFFQMFVAQQFDVNILQLWLAAESFRQISARKLLENRASKIFDKFLAPSAPCLVVVDAEPVARIEEQLTARSIGRTTFVDVQKQAFVLLEEAFRKQFLVSDQYNQWRIIYNITDSGTTKQKRRQSFPNTTPSPNTLTAEEILAKSLSQVNLQQAALDIEAETDEKAATSVTTEITASTNRRVGLASSSSHKSSSRKLSRVSSQEMQAAHSTLENVFNMHTTAEDATTKDAVGKGAIMTEQQFLEFAEESGLLGKKLDRSSCALIFQRVRIGKRTTIDFERFKEAFRNIAASIEVTYTELVQIVADEKAA